MIEKIKDILYDLSDIVVSLIIIAIIFVSVSWKISDTLDVDLKETLTKPTAEAEADIPVTVIIPEIDPNGIPESTDSTGEGIENTDPEGDSATSTPESTEPSGDATPPSDPAANTTSEPAAGSTASNVLNSFEVPEGATGSSIGKKLVSEGYVADVNTFVNRLVALKLDNKLRAGTFKLSKSDPLDTIIKVLAGQDR